MNTNGTTLYRGLTPGMIGLDVHGGYGETWTRDFNYARGYVHSPQGYVLEAVLHPSAKRLILTTEPDGEGFTEYVKEGIKTLVRLIGEPWLYDSELSGRRCLWEIWEPEWTEVVIKAGYDTIFTAGFDGPEEYVLNPHLLQFVCYYRVLANNQIEAYPIEPGTLAQLGYVVGVGTAVN